MAFRTDDVAAICFLEHCLNTYFGCFPVLHHLIPRWHPLIPRFTPPWFPVLHHLIPRFTPSDSPFYTPLIPCFTPPWFPFPFPVPIPRSHSPFPFLVPIPRSHSPIPRSPVLKIAVDNTSFTWVRVEWSSVVIMFCPSVWCRVQIQVGACRWSK